MPVGDTAAEEQVLFEGGPPDKLQSWLGLTRADRPRFVLRALLVIAIGWLPLLLLTVPWGNPGTSENFLLDFGAQARFLLAAPLLVLAQAFCLPRLAAIARQFLSTGLIDAAAYPRYQRAVHSTRGRMNSTLVEVVVVLLAYLLAASLLLHLGHGLPAWYGAVESGVFVVTPAGWWAGLVSLPLLLVLLLGWVWRWCLWTRFLWLMSRIGLRLIPAHPDHAAGLKFVNYSVRAFLPLGLVIGVLFAGSILNRVVHHAEPPLQFKFQILGVAVTSVAIFISPLLVFLGRLIETQRQGMFSYGGLANAMGREFEAKWFSPHEHLDRGALAASDFSSTTDLYSIVANVYAMRALPLELRNLVLLTLVTLLPFLPVVLMSAPLDVLLDKLAALFL